MHFAHSLGLGQNEKIIIPFKRARPVFEPFPAKVFFFQLLTLQHRPHRAIEHEDTRFRRRFNLRPDRHSNSLFKRDLSEQCERVYKEIFIYMKRHTCTVGI